MKKFRESEKQFVHPKPIYDDGKYKLFEIKSWQDMQSVGQDIPDCKWYELSSYHREKDFKSSLRHTIDGKFYVVEIFKAIGEYAFRDCENLKVLDFSKVEGPFVIQGSAFKNTGLEEIIIPSNTLLERRVFENCEQLTKVTISEGITSLPTECFQECSSLTEVKLPTSLRNIRANAFNQCGSLTKIELPPRLTNLGIDVFNGCDLRYIKIPKRVACIPEDAFKRNENLSKVEVSVNLTKIGDEAFYGCKALTDFEVYDQASDPEYEIYLDVEWENDSFTDCPVQEIFQAGQKNNFEVSFDDENEEY